MAKKEGEIKNNLATNGVYVLMDDINMETCRECIKWIMNCNLATTRLPKLTLIINSPGGDVHAAFALIDTMKASTIPIKTVGLGLIASCGFLIFIAGKKGQRILTPNTSILSHQYSWGSDGKEHELYARVKEFELSTRRMIEHYKKCIGMTEKKIKEVLLPPQDVWLSSEEARKLKICDKIEQLY
jgi:ATP-dependent Clp protease protease subunit|tara:strand:- start:2347 stop:2901 length:555 start_codon:yes stop_codon:yes gene_type:complete